MILQKQKRMFFSRRLLLLLIAMSFSSVVGALPTESRDPLENYNRGIFYFNDKVDVYILKPIATLYNAIMPKPLNQGIHNVFNNLNMVTTIANDVLQLHFYQMMHDMWRLGINTTLGIGGLFDVASRIGLKPYSNDFGLTLARYGWKDSMFIVWPFFGPGTLRDGVEIVIDYNYFSIYPYINSDAIRYGIYGLGVVDRRAQLLKFQSVFEEVAIDNYIFMRDAYLQRRQFQIQENQRLGFLYQAPDQSWEETPSATSDSALGRR